MISAVIAMVSVMTAAGGSISESYLSAIGRLKEPWTYRISFSSRDEAEEFVSGLNQEMPDASLAVNIQYLLDCDMGISDSYIRMAGIDGDPTAAVNIELVDGNYPAQTGEVLVDDIYRQYITPNLKPGDAITLNVFSPVTKEKEQINFKICGFFRSPDSDITHMVGYTSADSVMQIIAGSDETPGYTVSVKADDDYEKALDYALNYLTDRGRRSEWSDRVAINRTFLNISFERDNNSNSVISVFIILGIFIGISSLFMFINLFQMTFPDKVRRFGLLRSMGLDRNQMIVSLILDMILYLLFGSIFGFILYFLIEKIYGDVFIKSFLGGINISDYVDISWHFSLSMFLMSCLIVLMMVMSVNIWVMIKNIRTSPISAISYRGESVRTGHFRKLKKDPVKAIGYRNIQRSKWRSIYTAVNIFLITLLLCTSFEVFGCLEPENAIIYTKSSMFDYEFYRRDEETFIPDDIIDRIRSIDGVEELCTARITTRELQASEGQSISPSAPVQIRIYGDTVFERICFDNGIDPDIYVNTPGYLQLLNDENIPIGEVMLEDKNGNEVRVSDIVPINNDAFNMEYLAGADSLVLIMNDNAGKKLIGDYEYNTIYVSSNSGRDAFDKIMICLKEAGISLFWSDLGEETKSMREELKSFMYIGIYIMSCIGLIAIVNILCNITLNIRNRQREYGIIRAMGMNVGNICRLVIYEIVSVSVYAVIFAVSASIPISGWFLKKTHDLNLLKQIPIAIICGMAVYLVIYVLCFVSGRYGFSRNIVTLTRQE